MSPNCWQLWLFPLALFFFLILGPGMGWVSISRIRLESWNLWIGTVIVLDICWVLTFTSIDHRPLYVLAYLILSVFLRGRLLLGPIVNRWRNWGTKSLRSQLIELGVWTRRYGWILYSGFLTTTLYILPSRNENIRGHLFPFLYFARMTFEGQGLTRDKVLGPNVLWASRWRIQGAEGIWGRQSSWWQLQVLQWEPPPRCVSSCPGPVPGSEWQRSLPPGCKWVHLSYRGIAILPGDCYCHRGGQIPTQWV